MLSLHFAFESFRKRVMQSTLPPASCEARSTAKLSGRVRMPINREEKEPRETFTVKTERSAMLLRNLSISPTRAARKKSLISSKDVKQVTPASRVRFSFIERRCKSKNIAAMPLRRFLLLPPPALSHYDIKRKRKHRNQSATWNTNIFLFFGALEEDFGLPFAPFSVFRATLVAFLAFLKCSAARAGFFSGPLMSINHPMLFTS